jgi:predicted ribosome quality control (RQC) complex YloA/Tae2 family protein
MPKEISPAKRRRALVLYVQGLPFVEIATKTGLSTGSVANIVQEAKEGKFEEVRDVREQIDGLRELSVALRKGKLEIAQAFLGLSFYERLVTLGIGPDALDSWAKMCHEISPPDYAVEEFVNAALRLKELERLKGMAYEELVEDYETKSEALNEVESKTNELETTRQALSEEIHNLSDEKRTLKAEVRGLSTERSLISGRLKKWKEEEEDLKAEVAEIQKRLGGLKRESKRLESRTVALREEVDQK